MTTIHGGTGVCYDAAMSKPEAGQARWRRRLGYGLGGGLLALAVGFAVSGVDWDTLRSASPWALAALAGLVGVNYFVTGLLFWNITRTFDAEPTVRATRMIGLIAVSGLLNYVPVVRAGLWGRAAYLKKHHGLPVRQSLIILGVVLALTAVVVGGAGLVMMLGPASWRWPALAGGLLLATVITPTLAERLLRRPVAAGWAWVPLRTIDFAAAAGRLGLALAIVGQSADAAEVLVLASASLLVKIAGLTPNGLGLSEWAVVALSAAVTPIEASAAAAAALLDRGAEVLVSIALGGTALVWLRKPAT
ncbi:MAG: hypothetical protein AAGL98_00945 [Planctomycetota bacterium]